MSGPGTEKNAAFAGIYCMLRHNYSIKVKLSKKENSKIICGWR